MTHDAGATPLGVIALGASAGGIDALQRAVAGLPPDSPFAFCVVLHLAATPRSVLAEIIARRTRLSVSAATHGAPLRRHHVYVAPPDHHLLVADGRVVLNTGPKENSARPAIDVLFRSVAEQYGARGAAVVLSGALSDGAAGAAAVAAAGGLVLVQDPSDAAVPSMPAAALRAVPGAHVTTAVALAEALSDFAAGLSPAAPQEVVNAPMVPDPPPPHSLPRTRPSEPPSGFTCPECHGPLWERSTAGVIEFRCRVGHVYSQDFLVEEKGAEVEAAMWSAVEALEEHAELLLKVAGRVQAAGRDRAADLLQRRAQSAVARAETLRVVLGSSDLHPEPEAA
jgi:two-component system chemotaxis response regulator CheB